MKNTIKFRMMMNLALCALLVSLSRVTAFMPSSFPTELVWFMVCIVIFSIVGVSGEEG